MKKQVFVISVAFAAGLGLGELELGAAKAAIPKPVCETIRGELSAPAEAAASSYMVTNLKDEADETYGTDKLTLCEAKKNGFSVSWDKPCTPDEKAFIANASCVAGEWTAGESQ